MAILKNLNPLLNLKKRFGFIFIALSFGLLTSAPVAAEEVTSKESPATNVEEISDPRLKAEIGSLSQWSYKSSFSYQAGSLETPLAEDRPDYLSSSDSNPAVSLYYSFSLKYRLTQKSDLLLGSGFLIEKPFHRTSSEAFGSNFSLSNPYINWVVAYGVEDMQMISSISTTIVTERFEKEILKSRAYVTLGQTILKNMNSISLSGSFYFTQNLYSDSSDFYNYLGSDYRRSDHSLSFTPSVDYSFNEVWGMRTSFNFFQYRKLKGESKYSKTINSQSLGISYSPSRRFYFYPNIQFVPEDLKPSRTNLSIFFYLNLF